LSDDPIYGKNLKFSSHAQALTVHKKINWNYLIEPDKRLLVKANDQWGIKYVFDSLDALGPKNDIEIIVFAETPNNNRLDIIKQFKNTKGIVFEKPVAVDLYNELEIMQYCKENNIVTAVNYSRRFSKSMQDIKLKIEELIGHFQCGFAVYCNGYKNNASHLIDLIIYYFGKIDVARCLQDFLPNEQKNINPAFDIFLRNNKSISFKSVDPNFYRENMIDIWGSRGRLSMIQESSICLLYELKQNRLITNNKELQNDKPRIFSIDLGDALYNLYDNLCFSIKNGEKASLCSLNEAIKTSLVIDAIDRSKKNKYQPTIVNEL
jgi:predicted dehydrogenase